MRTSAPPPEAADGCRPSPRHHSVHPIIDRIERGDLRCLGDSHRALAIVSSDRHPGRAAQWLL